MLSIERQQGLDPKNSHCHANVLRSVVIALLYTRMSDTQRVIQVGYCEYVL
jgi:hypothetical protein